MKVFKGFFVGKPLWFPLIKNPCVFSFQETLVVFWQPITKAYSWTFEGVRSQAIRFAHISGVRYENLIT